MASALRRALSAKSRAVSTPAVEKDIAPKNPAAMRQKLCHSMPVPQPVASSDSAVVSSPKLNSRVTGIRPISTMVTTAPARYPSAFAVLSHPACA